MADQHRKSGSEELRPRSRFISHEAVERRPRGFPDIRATSFFARWNPPPGTEAAAWPVRTICPCS